MTDDDVVTTQERYIRATKTANLDVEERVRRPADYLISAGRVMSEDRNWDTEIEVSERRKKYIALCRRLAFMLMRLVGEFDNIKGDIDLARRYLSPARKLAEREYTSLWRGKVRLDGPTRELQHLDVAEQEELAVLASAHSFAMLQLKSLSETRDVLHRWAEIEATRRAYMLTDKEVSAMIGPILDIFIDANCYKCGGRGSTGKHGAPQRICPACSGVGKRHGRNDGREAKIGRTQVQNDFAGHVLSEMDRMVEAAVSDMNRQFKGH